MTAPVDRAVEREKFEAQFPVPRDCIWCGNGYSATEYNAWDAHKHHDRWIGWFMRAELSAQTLASKEAELAAREAEIVRLNTLINTPHTADWITSVELEAAHQQERCGAEHDAGKAAQDWFWLLGYLSGKALASFVKGDREKGLHHIVSSSAVLLNWHRNVTGQNTGMRPGIAEPAALTKQPPKD